MDLRNTIAMVRELELERPDVRTTTRRHGGKKIRWVLL